MYIYMIGGSDKIDWNKTPKLTLEYILNSIDNADDKREVLKKLEKWNKEFKDSLQYDPTDVDVEDEHDRGWNDYLKYESDIKDEIENYDLFIKAIKEGYDDEELFPSLEKIHNEKWHNEILGKINSINDTMAITRASLKKKKRLTKRTKTRVKAAAKDIKKQTQKAKSSKKLNKISLKKSKTNMISKKKYNELIKKRQHHKKMTLNERKQLDHALFINYCSCIKKLKNKKTKEKLEYPICMSSIYNKRKFKSPKNARSKCKKYK